MNFKNNIYIHKIKELKVKIQNFHGQKEKIEEINK